jgi:Cellulase (glycosyl hydrolase family 5)
MRVLSTGPDRLLRSAGRLGPLRRVLIVGLVAAVAAAAGGVAGAGAVRTYSTHGTLPLRTAIFDPFTFSGPQHAEAFGMTHAAGASYVRIVARWSSLAPADPPKDFVASDQASPYYRWSWLDTLITAAQKAGLTPIVDVGGPPGWALVAKTKGQDGGTPKTTALQDFATAIATHYDGHHGAPTVHVWQIWNEANLSLDLSPVSAAHYRTMINAFAAAVHRADAANVVVAGDLDPFRNKTKRFHTQAPLAFMRALLCVSMGNPKAKTKALRLPHATCHNRVDFEVWSHHPYTFKGPFGHARYKDDVSLGDLPKMRAVLKAAIKLHHIVSTHPVQFWVTEFSWDTKPPRRHAAPVALEARWTAEALYQMWRSGVSLVTWFGFVDQGNSQTNPYQSGLFFHAKSLKQARAKPMRTAFRFPFVAYLGKSTVSVWGRDATSEKTVVTVQRRHGTHGGWRTVARIRANSAGIFKASLRLKATPTDWLRATAPGSGQTLAFSLKPPSPNLRYGPWGN